MTALTADRLPLRVRLAAAAAGALAVVLTGLGVFVYDRVGDALLSQVDEVLETRAEALVRAVAAGRPPALAGDEEDFTQVLSADGAPLAGTTGVRVPPLEGPQLRQARTGPLLLDTQVSVDDDDDDREPARVLVTPVGDRLAVVGASLEDREEALEGLLTSLLVAAPVAVGAAAVAGHLLAGAALRPVEAMRRRADEVTAETSGERLPLPRARDELHRLGATLNAMLARLDEGLLRERRFVADASHELRTPLAALQVELELALRRPRPAQQLTAALEAAASDVERLVALAEDLLVLASAAQGSVSLRCEPVDVRSLVAGAVERVGPRAQAAGRQVRAGEVADGTVPADRLRTERALDALVDNALRHGTGRVEVTARFTDDGVVLAVADEGGGLPAEFLPRAFDRFSRPDAARTAGGSGLGLALVREVARAHGGTARVVPGAGGRVELVLPRSGPAGGAEPEAQHAGPGPATARR